MLNNMKEITRDSISINITEFGDHNYYEVLDLVDSDDAINRVFGENGRTRFLTGKLFTIRNKEDNELIGFANLTHEGTDSQIYFLDRGIKEKYRGKHIGTYVLDELSKEKTFIVAETEKSNVLSNASLKSRAVFLEEINDRNLYLLQKERYSEFMREGHLKKIRDYRNGKQKFEYDEIKEEKGKVKKKTK